MEKKILYLFLFVCISCKPYQTEFKEYEARLPKHAVDKVLKEYKAEEKQYSLVLFTNYFNGQEFILKNDNQILLKEPLTTIQNFGLAKMVRINNQSKTKIINSDKHITIPIKISLAKKYKYIYIEKLDYLKDVIGNDSVPNTKKVYKVIYSNTLIGFM